MKKSNKRRFPVEEKIMSDKNFSDLVYGYLLLISHSCNEKEVYYVMKRDFLKKDMAKRLEINFRTFQRKFNYLVDNGYLIETAETYELPKVSEENFLISVDELEVLVDMPTKNVIRVYSYLERLKICKDKYAYVTKSDLLIKLGYKIKTDKVDRNGNVIFRAATNTRNWNAINKILELLESKFN